MNTDTVVADLLQQSRDTYAAENARRLAWLLLTTPKHHGWSTSHATPNR